MALSLTVNTGDVPHPFHTPPSPDYSEGMGGPQDSRPESPASQHLCGEEGEESTREEEIAEMNQEAEEEESRECSKEEDDFELSLRSDSSGSGDGPRPPDATSAPPQCVDGTEEPLLGEDTGGGDCEEETLCGRSQEDHQGSASEEEDEGEEEQLCELVQRLKKSLSLPTHTAGSQRRDVLLVAAQGVGDSVSNLVSMVNFCSGDPPQPRTLKCL